MEGKLLSYFSVSHHGYRICSNDLVIPKDAYKMLLKGYPELEKAADAFFAEHKKATSIVFADFKENFQKECPCYFE